MKNGWLWDKKINFNQVRAILKNPQNPKFLHFAAILLSRNNNPKDVFGFYLNKKNFLQYWPDIKRLMRKDTWNNPRIDFWQAVFETLLIKYRREGVKLSFVRSAKPVNEFCKEVGLQLKELRKNRGLTQEMLADKLNISQKMLSRVENGTENPSLLTLKKILDVFGAKIIIK